MKNTVIDFTYTFWHRGKFFITGILLFAINGACDGYDMQDYCDAEFSFLWKNEYQIKLTLDDNQIYDNANDFYPYQRTGYCETKFEAWSSTYSNLMFYFEDLDLDCDEGHLEFYTGESSNTRVSGLEGDICGGNKPEGVYTVDDRYLRIQYVPKRSQNIRYIFSIIITIYGDGFCPSYAHECANSRCIYDELACNGYDSCGDDSGCDLNTGAIVGIVIGGLVGLGLIISLIICCFCWRRRSGRTPGTVQSTATSAVTYSGQTQQPYSQPMYGFNQGSPYNPNQPSYPVATAPSMTDTASGQQGYSHPMYGFNQGVNYPNSQPYCPTVSQNSGNNQHQADEKQYNAPPPQYGEIFSNSEPGTNQPIP